MGIEVPNKENNVVLLRELLESEDFKRHGSHMAFAVGKDIGGQVVVTGYCQDASSSDCRCNGFR